MKRTFLTINIFTYSFILLAGFFFSTLLADDFRMTIESPSRGDKLEIGKEVEITWSDDNHHEANDHVITLFISRESGGTFEEVGEFPLDNYQMGDGGTIDWTVTGPASEECRIKLSHKTDDSHVSGVGQMRSNDLFTIEDGVSIKLPNYFIKSNNILTPSNALGLMLFDLNGRLVWESNKGTSITELQNKVKSGLYLLRFTNESKNVTLKINLTQ